MQPGDYIYKKEDDGLYHICRILDLDNAADVAHIATYAALNVEPQKSMLDHLEKQIGHVPIAASSFSDWAVFASAPLTDDDLQGYRMFLDMTGATPQITKQDILEANKFYTSALGFHGAKDFTEAIKNYREAYRLFPLFYEAKDNEAFCHMSLGDFDAAIACFEESARSNESTFLTDFSIGECFFKMGAHDDRAMAYFNLARAHHDLTQENISHIDAYVKHIKRRKTSWITSLFKGGK